MQESVSETLLGQLKLRVRRTLNPAPMPLVRSQDADARMEEIYKLGAYDGAMESAQHIRDVFVETFGDIPSQEEDPEVRELFDALIETVRESQAPCSA